MKILILLTFLTIMFAGCDNEKPTSSANITESELSETLNNDDAFHNYCAARKELVFTRNMSRNIKDLHVSLQDDIIENKFQSVEEFKAEYVRKGGDPVFLAAFDNFYESQRILAQRYREVIKTNKTLFKKVLVKNCPPI